MIIRREEEKDYRKVEELTRDAFWNLQVPGCDEHYLVHKMRNHPESLPELSLVVEEKGEILAHVMYAESTLTNELGDEKKILTFGPISVAPNHQRKGYGRAVLEQSFQRAVALGYDCVVILGAPHNYFCYGFKNAIRFDMTMEDGTTPTALLVKELVPDALAGHQWVYHMSQAHHVDMDGFDQYDATFEPREKGYQPSQEYFYTFVRSHVQKENS